MDGVFHERLSKLRKGRGISQRKVASDLFISQALLSHYENGIREPGLDFVCRACAYYEVSADCLLGRVAVSSDLGKGSDVGAEMQVLAEATGEAVALTAALMERLIALEEQIAGHMSSGITEERQ